MKGDPVNAMSSMRGFTVNLSTLMDGAGAIEICDQQMAFRLSLPDINLYRRFAANS